MKRFHVHVHVEDIAKSVAFYSKLFAAEPARLEADYAKWMLEDPRLNFAISARGTHTGVGHLGLQAEDAAELEELHHRADDARGLAKKVVEEGEVSCCYARSDKHWVIDPQGVAWEQFHTLEPIASFDGRGACGDGASACCAETPAATAAKAASPAACGTTAAAATRTAACC